MVVTAYTNLSTMTAATSSRRLKHKSTVEKATEWRCHQCCTERRRHPLAPRVACPNDLPSTSWPSTSDGACTHSVNQASRRVPYDLRKSGYYTARRVQLVLQPGPQSGLVVPSVLSIEFDGYKQFHGVYYDDFFRASPTRI